MTSAPKPSPSTETDFEELLQAFDEAAQRLNSRYDPGYGPSAFEAATEYQKARQVLSEANARLVRERDDARDLASYLDNECNHFMDLHAKTEAELAEANRKLAEVTKDRDDWKREWEMYQRAWLRELGGRVFNKAHRIDAYVLTTRWLREQKERPAQTEFINAVRAFLVGNEYDEAALATVRAKLAEVDAIENAAHQETK